MASSNAPDLSVPVPEHDVVLMTLSSEDYQSFTLMQSLLNLLYEQHFAGQRDNIDRILRQFEGFYHEEIKLIK